jgi:hypothetical protein
MLLVRKHDKVLLYETMLVLLVYENMIWYCLTSNVACHLPCVQPNPLNPETPTTGVSPLVSSPHQATPSTHRATASSLTTWPSVPSLSAATQVSSTTSTNSPARGAPAKSQGLHESRRLPTVLFTLTNHNVYFAHSRARYARATSLAFTCCQLHHVRLLTT